MRATGLKIPAETNVNLGRKYQGERPFPHSKADLVREVGLRAGIRFQGRRPYSGQALQFAQYRFIQDRTESLRSALCKTNLTPARHRFWRSATYGCDHQNHRTQSPDVNDVLSSYVNDLLSQLVNDVSNRTAAPPPRIST